MDIFPEAGRIVLALPPIWAAWRALGYQKVWDERRFDMLEAGVVALAAAPARSPWRAIRRAAEERWRGLSPITGEALARAVAPLEATEAAAAALRRTARGGRRRLAGECWTAEVAWGATAADGPGSGPGSWVLAVFRGRRGKASIWVAGCYPPQELASALSPEPPAP